MDSVSWRVLVTDPMPGAWNMAVDEALMRYASSSGRCVLRVYGWSRPTLSFGRNQRALGLYDLAAIQGAGIGTVRRPTGGRAVLHHREVTYSVVAPETRLGSLQNSYGRINRILLTALNSMGVPATSSAGAGRTPSPGPSPCFDSPSRGEVVVGNRKLVGSAQWRDGGVLLQHGSILMSDDQTLIRGLLLERGTPEPAPATLSEVMGREPAAAEIADALRNALVTLEDSEASAMGIDELPAETMELAHGRYLDDGWTWRR